MILGFEGASDAGVYRLRDDLALVQTVDFFTPIVDDPRTFGQIAAANSLSDVYAMGGHPITALNIACIPKGQLDPADVGAIFAGGFEKAKEAGCSILGGHTVEGAELFYGLSVTGTIDPRRLIANNGARAGDVLVLTKPIGTGIVTTAKKLGKLKGHEDWLEVTITTMSQLNRAASEAMVSCGAHGATDITGFGLLGHGMELAAASDVTLEIEAGQVLLLPGALELAQRGVLTGADCRNRQYVDGTVVLEGVSEGLERVLFDAQTSGGLLIAVPAENADRLLDLLEGYGTAPAAKIGFVAAARGETRIVVRP